MKFMKGGSLVDKRRFYKELMSEYTFDKDKILANAKKGKMAGRKPLPLYIGMTAAAAAIIVTVSGVSIAMNLPSSSGVTYNPYESRTILELSPEERIKKAHEELLKNENSSEMRDVFVTFKSPLAPPQAQGVLASQSNVLVNMLIMEDNSRINTEKEIEAAFNGGTARIRGAVIRCAGYQMTQIDSSEFVDLVEVLSKEDLLNLTEIAPVPPADPVEPDNTSKPVESNNGVGGETPDLPVVNPNDPPKSDPITSSTGTDPAPSSTGETSNPGDPIIVEPQPTVPERLPSGVVLPSGAADKGAYITDDIGAEGAYFLTEDVFFVRTKNALRLYKWNGEIETLAAEQVADDVKICWISENGARLMVTSTENGVRSKMYIVDANNCTINDVKVENIVEGGSIAGAAYNEALDILAVNVKSEGGSDIYVANLSGYQAANETLVASGLSEGAVLLAANNSAVYFSNIGLSADAASTTIYKYFEGSVTEVLKLDKLCAAVTNSAFTHAVVVGKDGSFIFDPLTETLIPVQGDKKISFGVSAHSLACNGGYYTVSGGKLVSDDSIATIAKIDYMRSFSKKYAAIVSNGSVRIVSAPYTSEVLTEGVTFVQPVENASAEARDAVNSAIGMINALANGKLAQSGIDTADKLSQTIKACFASGAAQELKTRCGITDVSLNYKDGSLKAITITDTVLSMKNNESGTLYVKVGTFDGRAAYTAIPVKLVNEDGILKANCIIN